MKRWIITLLFLALSVGSATAQYIPGGTVKRRGCGMKVDKQKLSWEQQAYILSDIDGQDCTKAWIKARRTRGWGIGLTAGGATVTVVGAGATVVMGLATALGVAFGAGAGALAGSIGGEQQAQESANEAANQVAEDMKPILDACVAVTAAGFVTTVVGIPMWIAGTSRMNKIVKAYNNSHLAFEPEVQFGPSFAYSPALHTVAPGVGLTVNF
jgi:hypothetical protein